MSISQNFPAISPSLSLNFARSKTLDPRITFARPSTLGDATYMNENGLIVTAAADEPRFDHKYENGVIKSLGLLIEEQRSNLLTYSEQIGLDGVWGINSAANGTTTLNDATAPDGTTTATSVVSSGSFYGPNQFETVSASTSYTFSVWLKNLSATIPIRINIFGLYASFLNGSLSSINLSITANTTQSFPDNWYRVSITADSGAGGSKAIAIYGNTGANFQCWGAQLEVGAFPTSYIPTDDTIGGKTRSPDSVSMTGTNFTDWYNQDEGSVRILAKTNMIYGGTNRFPYSMQIDDGTGSNRIAVDNAVLSTTIRHLLSVWSDGSAIGNNLGNLQNVNGLPCSFAYKTDDLAMVNGAGTLFTDDDDDAPIAKTMNRLVIGGGAGGPINGTISQLTYYPRRLTNTQLQNLTK